MKPAFNPKDSIHYTTVNSPKIEEDPSSTIKPGMLNETLQATDNNSTDGLFKNSRHQMLELTMIMSKQSGDPKFVPEPEKANVDL